jgi:hypothetical protein
MDTVYMIPTFRDMLQQSNAYLMAVHIVYSRYRRVDGDSLY